MSNTVMMQGASAPNGRNRKGESSRPRTPSSRRTNGASKTQNSNPMSSSYHSGSPRAQVSSKGEKWGSEERARSVMAAANHGDEEEKVEYPIQPQKTPLSMAIAMKAATSPTLSSFPDSFWTPFLEQEEYNRQKLYGNTTTTSVRFREDNEIATPRKLQFHDEKPKKKRMKPKVATAARRSSSSSSKKSSFGMTTTILQSMTKACIYILVGLLLGSIVDVPYFRPVFHALSFVGRVILGFLLWLYVLATKVLWPVLKEQYHQYRLDDTLADIKDWLLENNIIDCHGVDETDCTLGSFFSI